MIVDSMERWGRYFDGPAWEAVAEFLGSLTPETPEGEYRLQGGEIFARVMSYGTRAVAEGALEAHRTYLDVQAVLCGAEGIAWHPAGGLEVRQAYDAAGDVEFYHTPELLPARVEVFPGTFVALFPEDAHMPQLQVAGMPGQVKKVVVKVPVSLAERRTAR